MLTAFFDTLDQHLGKTYKLAAISDVEKVNLATREWAAYAEPLVRRVYKADVPTPSAARGFEENVTLVDLWCATATGGVLKFLDGLALRRQDKYPPDLLVSSFGKRYRSIYLEFAASVPEFAAGTSGGS